MILTDTLNTELVARGDYSDITIRVFDHNYPLHRVILGQSLYFKSVIADKSHVDVHGVHILDLPSWVGQLGFEVSLLHIYGLATEKHEYEILVQFGYHGLCGLLATAHLLRLSKLRGFCLKKLVAFVTVENAPDIAAEFTRHKTRYEVQDDQVMLYTCLIAAASRGSSLPVEYWSRFVFAPDIVKLAFLSDDLYIADEWTRFNYLFQIYEHCTSDGAVDAAIPPPSGDLTGIGINSVQNLGSDQDQSRWITTFAKKIKWSFYSAKKPSVPVTVATATGETPVETESRKKEIEDGRTKLIHGIVEALNQIRFCYFTNDQLEFAHALKTKSKDEPQQQLIQRHNLENGLWSRMMLRQKLLACTSYSPPHLNIETFTEHPSYPVLGAKPGVVSQYPSIRFSSSFTLQEIRRATHDVQARRGLTVHYAGSTWTLVLARVRKHFPDICVRLAREGNEELKESPAEVKDANIAADDGNCQYFAETFDQRQRTCARFQILVGYLPTDEEGERIWREHFGGELIERLPLMTHYFTLNSVQEDSWQQVQCIEHFVKSNLQGSLRFSVVMTLL